MMLFNPYSGLPRDPQDILSDPAGTLVLDPNAPVKAADQKEAAVDRLRAALPHVFAAFQDAKENGLPTLAIAARNEDGSGKMYMTMNDPEDFLKDIAEISGVSFELSETQKTQYKVNKIMSRFGL